MQSRRFLEDFQQSRSAVDTTAFTTTNLFDDVSTFELFDTPHAGIKRDAELILNPTRGDKWIARKNLQYPARNFDGWIVTQVGSPLGEETIHAFSPAQSIFSLPGNAIQKILKPAIPVSCFRNGT